VANGFDLQQYVPYLLNRGAVRIADAFTDELRAFSITLPMWRVIAALWHDGPMRLGELAHLTSIEVSTLSRTVAGMEGRGLLTRNRSDADARAVRVELTAAGRALTERIIPLALAYERAGLQGFTPDEIDMLKRLLRRFYDNLAARQQRAVLHRQGP
jgi:MarR family transcriptional regulator, organic hydroperoxide resistance regulator